MRNERGLANSVQAALVMPAVFGLLVLVLHWAMWIWAGATAQAAAHDAARAAAALDGSVGVGRASAAAALEGGPLRQPSVEVRRGGARTVATVTGRPLSLLPFGHTVTRTVELPTERITRS